MATLMEKQKNLSYQAVRQMGEGSPLSDPPKIEGTDVVGEAGGRHGWLRYEEP